MNKLVLNVLPLAWRKRGWAKRKFLFLLSQYAPNALTGSMSGKAGVFHISTMSPNSFGTLGSLIYRAKEVLDIGMTSVPRRFDEGEKACTLLHRISPIRKEPQNETRAITQKACLSFRFAFQKLLAACPSNHRKGILTGLCVASATALTGFLLRFSYPLRIVLAKSDGLGGLGTPCASANHWAPERYDQTVSALRPFDTKYTSNRVESCSERGYVKVLPSIASNFLI